MKKLIILLITFIINLNADNLLNKAFNAEDKQQDSTAFNLYNKAINDTNLSYEDRLKARVNLALMHMSGELGKPNYIEGGNILAKTLKMPKLPASIKSKVLYNLGQLYQNGLGVSQDKKYALKLYNQLISLPGANAEDKKAARKAIKEIKKTGK